MRACSFLLPVCAALMLIGCDSNETEVEDAGDNSAAETVAELVAETQTFEGELDSTPLAERVATIGLLNKRNNISKDFEISPGDSVEEGPVIIRLEACERTAPYEFPQETGAFVQVDVLERGDSDHTRIFSGWLFKQNPSLNVVEHPIYDVWVKDCAMSFPGDE